MSKIEVHKTINVLALALLIAFLIFHKNWLLWLCLVFMVLNAFDNRLSGFIARLWMRFAQIVGHVNSKIILAAVFYLALTHISLLYRMFNKDLVSHFTDKNKETILNDVNKGYDRQDFERMW